LRPIAYPGIERIDFASDENITGLFGSIAAEVDDLVIADSSIITDYSDPVRQRRYWEVRGFARMSCGGTHPRTIGEVGRITLKRRNIGKGKERIEIALIGEPF
jgi:Ser-tRNA(Ala) deacylase AlaX